MVFAAPTGYRSALIALFLMASAAQGPSAVIRFNDFASTQGLVLVGAAAVAGDVLRLTPAKRNKTGATWLREKQPILAGFETTFQFQLTRPAKIMGGADGLAFVIQNSGPEALGGRGSAGGFGVADAHYSHHPGIPWSFAVFFDTWQNKNEGDPSDNFITVRTNGRPAKMRWPAERLAFTPKLSVDLKDGRVHTVRLAFERPVLAVFLDHSTHPVLQTALDLSPVADSEGKAWIGFTASTGWGFENHDILNWSFGGEETSSDISVVSSEISFPMSACLPNYNLCTPERAYVERKGAGYHVVLPGNLEWGVRVPNAMNTRLVVTNAHGIVCWDLKDRGSSGCIGPSGKEGHAGTGFLDEGAPAGSLISRTGEGSTWFSANGRTGDEFKNNEGFYEFDVEFK